MAAPTTSAAPPPLDRAAFRAWLAAKPADEPVGRANSLCSCPLAMWLNSLYPGAKYNCVSDEDYRVAPSPRVPLPAWSRAFVYTVDHGGASHPTAAQCLAILDAVPAEGGTL